MNIKLQRLVIILLLSITFTLLSFSYQRFGPEIGYLGADCRPDCEVHKLNAGWPLPYIFDSMGVSVINVLHLEDEFRPAPFIIDIILYAAVLILVTIFVERIRNSRVDQR
jgi:hypothetical protein